MLNESRPWKDIEAEFDLKQDQLRKYQKYSQMVRQYVGLLRLPFAFKYVYPLLEGLVEAIDALPEDQRIKWTKSSCQPATWDELEGRCKLLI